jgi:hypothetical protein
MVQTGKSPNLKFMFQVFYQTDFRPPQHGDGMWPPLAYAIDVLAVLAGIGLILGLLVAASVIVPFLLSH